MNGCTTSDGHNAMTGHERTVMVILREYKVAYYKIGILQIRVESIQLGT